MCFSSGRDGVCGLRPVVKFSEAVSKLIEEGGGITIFAYLAKDLFVRRR